MAKGTNKDYTKWYIEKTLGKRLGSAPAPKAAPTVIPTVELKSIETPIILETPKTIMVQPEPPKKAYEPVAEAPKEEYKPAKTPEPEPEEPEEKEKPGFFKRVINVFRPEKEEPADDYEMPEERKRKILEENSNETKLKKMLAENGIEIPELGKLVEDDFLPELTPIDEAYEEDGLEIKELPRGKTEPSSKVPKPEKKRKLLLPVIEMNPLEEYSQIIKKELGLTLEDITGRPYTIKEIGSYDNQIGLQKAQIGDKIIEHDKRDVTRIISYFDKRADKLEHDFPEINRTYNFYTKILDDIISTEFEKANEDGWYAIDETATADMNKKINNARKIYAAMDRVDKKIAEYKQNLSEDGIDKKSLEWSHLSPDAQAEKMEDYQVTNERCLAGYKEIKEKMDLCVKLHGYSDINRTYKTLKSEEFTFESEYLKGQKSSLLVLVSDLDDLED